LIPFLVAILLLIGVYFLIYFSKEKSGNWIQFFAKGKEAGFTIKDMEQLRRLVANCKINDPVGIFKSKKQFETVIRSMVNTLRLSGENYDPATQIFLSKLFDYFKKIEMESSENKIRITNSRQISEGQTLRVLVPGTGVFKSEVVKNFGNYLTISRPVNSKANASIQWHGAKISVYFWREEDAGYVFDTEVIDEVFSKGISSLKVEHNDSLFRTQKRKSMRVKFKKPAFLYLLNDIDNPHKLEKTAGLRCMLEDISDTGCAFKVTGQASVGMRFKLQFLLNKIPICIPATVRSLEYFNESNTSVIHMEADPLPIATRNHILCEVFNLLPDEDEEELPFRVLEDEADNTSPLQSVKEDPQKKFLEVMSE
jgi:c-di-GMP-binding flagellar brake protein YcgR